MHHDRSDKESAQSLIAQLCTIDNVPFRVVAGPRLRTLFRMANFPRVYQYERLWRPLGSNTAMSETSWRRV